MNHKQKKTLARRLQTTEERKKNPITKGTGIFESVAWEKRKKRIALDVKKRDSK